MPDDDGAREFYYKATGQTSGWYDLSESQRREWRTRYENAKRRARRVLAKLKG